MKKEIKEALEWAEVEVKVEENWLDNHYDGDGLDVEAADRRRELRILRTLRTALEEYGKPKTVSREWVENIVDEIKELIGRYGEFYETTFKERFTSELREQGIEVEGDK